MEYADANARPLKEREAMRGSPSCEVCRRMKTLERTAMQASEREMRERVSRDVRAAETVFVEGEGDLRTIVAIVCSLGNCSRRREQ